MFRTFDPFREFDRRARTASFRTAVPYDTLRFEDRFELRFDVPGIDPDSIELTVDQRELTLSFERSVDVPEGATLVARRRPTGTLRQRLYLGEGLDAERLDASYEHGVLVVAIPVVEAAQPRRISIENPSEAPAVEAA